MKIGQRWRWCLRGLSVALAVCSIVLAYAAYARSRLPLNELGRYFDGTVVWHQQGIPAYASLAVIFACLAALLYLCANR